MGARGADGGPLGLGDLCLIQAGFACGKSKVMGLRSGQAWGFQEAALPLSAPPPASPFSSSRGADGHICRLTGTAGDALLVSRCSFIFAWIFFFNGNIIYN